MTNFTAIKTRHWGSLVFTYTSTLARLGSITYDVPTHEIAWESLTIISKKIVLTHLYTADQQ